MNHSSIRTLAAIAALTAATSVFANGTQEAAAPKGPVKIVVWTNNRHDAAYMTEQVAKFNEARKGDIEIEYVMQTDNYVNMLTMAAASNQAPAVFNESPADTNFHLEDFVKAGLVVPLDPYIDANFRTVTNLDNYRMDGLNVLNGKVYYAPTGMRSGVRLIYNKELFKKAGITSMPKNLDDLVEYAKRITKVGGGVQYGVVIPGQSAPMVRMIIPIADVSGVQPYDYKAGKFDFSGYAPILKAFRQMFADGSVLPGAASMKVDPTRVQFAEGNVGFYGNASQEVGVLTKQFPAKMEWGAAEMPSVDGKIRGALTCTPNNGWLITSQCRYPEKAWEVIKFLSSAELNVGYVEAGLSLSIAPSVMQQVDKTKLGKLAEFNPVPYEGVYPAVPNVSPQGKVWQDALWDTVLPGGPDIAATIAQLNKTYNEALDREASMGKVKRLVIADFDPLKPSSGKFTYLDK